MSRAPSRRAFVAIASAAATMPVPAHAATPATSRSDPAIAAWGIAKRAKRRWLSASAAADSVDPPDPALEAENDAAWKNYEAAMEELIAMRPTTIRGLLAKITAAHGGLDHDCNEWSRPLLASLLTIDPSTLAAG